MNMEESNEVRVKNEPICDSQSISQNSETKRHSILVKEEPIYIEVKIEEKFSSTEEFANKASIAFLNEETTATSSGNNQATTIETNKTLNSKTNKLQKSR